ncbi:NF038129 family PEP-CTERM protein [Chitinimonas naiadis]
MNMKRLQQTLIGLLAGLMLSLTAQASVVYNVKVNTSSLAGTQGYLDLGLIGLADSPLAQAAITGLSGGTALGNDTLDGDSSVIAGGWALGNTTGFNAILSAWEFGQELAFQLVFSGDWEGNGVGSGTTFAFKLWDSAIGNTLLSDDAQGDLFRIDLWPGALVDISTFGTDGTPAATIQQVTAVPEPTSIALLLAGLLAISLLRAARQRKQD